MSTNNHYDILIATISGTLLFLLLACFVLALLMINRKKKHAHMMEKQQMKDNFEKQLLLSQLEMQEQSFDHISQEIHDNVGQILSLTTMQLNILELSDILNRPVLEDARGNLGKAILDLRDIAKGLNTERISRFTLVENVQDEINRIQRSGILVFNLRSEGRERELSPDKKLIIFRIIQESLQNILKHARAKEVSLRFGYEEEKLQITIRDDGRGFDLPDTINNATGLGLNNIIKRVDMIGGKVVMESSIDQGSTINIFIPYV